MQPTSSLDSYFFPFLWWKVRHMLELNKMPLFQILLFFSPVVTCPAINTGIQHGTVQLKEGNGLTAGSLYSFVCDIGYMISGPPLVYCNSSGAWTHPVPSCRSEYFVIFAHEGMSECCRYSGDWGMGVHWFLAEPCSNHIKSDISEFETFNLSGSVYVIK